MTTVYDPPTGGTFDEFGNPDPNGEYDSEGYLLDYDSPVFSDEEIDEAFRTAADGTDEKTAEFAHDNRLSLLASTYQLADSILARSGISVVRVTEPNKKEAAWTDGKIVYVNDAVISATDFDNIENLNGANFHELCHILFSPRRGTAFIKDLQAANMEQSYIILEDQRAETLVSVMYPSTTVWLSSQVLRWVLDTPSVAQYGYIYIRGRRYLDGKLRGLLRSTFIRPDLLPEIDRIIDAYRKLVFPRDFAIAKQLIEDWDKIIKELMPPQDDACNHSSGYNSPAHGHAVTQATQKALQNQEGPSEDESSPGGDGAGEGEGNGEGDEGDNQATGTLGRGIGAGDPNDKNTGANNKDPLEGLAREGLNSIRNRPDIKKEIGQKQRQIGASEGDPLAKADKSSNRLVSEEGISNRNKLVRVLEKLVMAADPGWLNREHSGKLNVSRFMAEQDYDTAFDQWEEGVHDATDMEVVILTDDSGSMSGSVVPALEASWAVKSALDTLGIPVTSALFSNTLRTLYTRKERAERTVMRYNFQAGGTDVNEALEMATRVFINSKKKQKILIAFTDGAWSHYPDKHGITPDEYIDKLNKMGVVTAVGYVDRWAARHVSAEDVSLMKQRYGHGATVFGILHPGTMVQFMKSLVTTSIQNTIRRGRR